jgi:hypothetical protein
MKSIPICYEVESPYVSWKPYAQYLSYTVCSVLQLKGCWQYPSDGDASGTIRAVCAVIVSDETYSFWIEKVHVTAFQCRAVCCDAILGVAAGTGCGSLPSYGHFFGY